MESILSTLAFALLIGAQFLAAIVLIAKRKAIYGGLEDHEIVEHPCSERMQSAAAEREPPAKAA
jgi:hypothetical protein